MLLNPLTCTLQVGRIWAQNFSYFFDCDPLRITDDVAINGERNSGIRVAKLSLGGLHAFRHTHTSLLLEVGAQWFSPQCGPARLAFKRLVWRLQGGNHVPAPGQAAG
jgi:hypothetical protein